jgi:hypothetical protein
MRCCLLLASSTGMSERELGTIVDRLRPTERTRGRPWSRSLEDRLCVVCFALRTNLTFRELAAVFAMSRSQAHRIVADLVSRLAALLIFDLDRRRSWIVDGTLIPTRDHDTAAKSKNYRWSCNLQVLVRRDLRVIAISGGGPGNRNDPVHYRGSEIEALCRYHRRVLADGGYRGQRHLVLPRFRGRRITRDQTWRRHRKRRVRVEHAIARLKCWRVLRDHRRRGRHLVTTARAVAFLHNLYIDFRDST